MILPPAILAPAMLVSAILAPDVAAQMAPAPDAPVAPAATLAEFEAALATHDSATVALEGWCAARHIAAPARIIATPAPGSPVAEPGGLRRLLGVSSREKLGYRHVRLSCGDRVLSEAHNWYVPARLAPEMAETLATTDTPFGKVVAPLHFTRHRLSSLAGQAPFCPAGTVLAHSALLLLPDGKALALVLECYTPANLMARPGG